MTEKVELIRQLNLCDYLWIILYTQISKTFSYFRYIMIAHNGLYSKVYKKYWIAFMIVFCWIFSYGMQLPTLLGIWGKIQHIKYNIKYK